MLLSLLEDANQKGAAQLRNAFKSASDLARGAMVRLASGIELRFYRTNSLFGFSFIPPRFGNFLLTSADVYTDNDESISFNQLNESVESLRTFYHEFGHAIDYSSVSSYFLSYSSEYYFALVQDVNTYKNAICFMLLGEVESLSFSYNPIDYDDINTRALNIMSLYEARTIEQLLVEYIDSISKKQGVSQEVMTQILEMGFLNFYHNYKPGNSVGIMDIMSAVLGSDYTRQFYTHDANYWEEKPWRIYTEAFAHMFSFEACGDYTKKKIS